jgi:hypothetical protein
MDAAEPLAAAGPLAGDLPAAASLLKDRLDIPAGEGQDGVDRHP